MKNVSQKLGVVLVGMLLCPAFAHGRRATDAEMQEITQVISAHPTATNYAERARRHFTRGEFDAAVEDDNRVLALEKTAHHYLDRATDLFNCKRWNDAISDCNRILRLATYGSEDFMGALGVRADCYEALHQYEKAIADAKILIRLGDRNAPDALKEFEAKAASAPK
jgi:tetratricopeptide (TPR) repeat protein